MIGLFIGGAGGEALSAPPFPLRARVWRLGGIFQIALSERAFFEKRAVDAAVFDAAVRFPIATDKET